MYDNAFIKKDGERPVTEESRKIFINAFTKTITNLKKANPNYKIIILGQPPIFNETGAGRGGPRKCLIQPSVPIHRIINSLFSQNSCTTTRISSMLDNISKTKLTEMGSLLKDIANGDKYMKVYKQMKMYNDDELNPVLRGVK